MNIFDPKIQTKKIKDRGSLVPFQYGQNRQVSSMDRTDKSEMRDRTDRSDNLTMQVTCVGQLSRFLRCFPRKLPPLTLLTQLTLLTLHTPLSTRPTNIISRSTRRGTMNKRHWQIAVHQYRYLDLSERELIIIALNVLQF